MGFNYRKSINIAKGIRVNFSKSGPSISFGKTGMRFSVNAKGQARGTVGVPGSGMYYNKQVNIFSAIKRLFGSDENQAKDRLEEEMADPSLDEPTKGQVRQQLFENHLERIRNVHKEVDETIDWSGIAKDPSGEEPEDDNLRDLARRVLAGEDEAYLTVIAEMDPFEDLTEFGSDFEVGVTMDGILGVTFNVHSEKVVPTEVIKVLKSGKESVKPMSRTMRNALIRDYVASTAFRVARDLFALLPVDQVVINAEEAMLNPATGHQEDMTLLSVVFPREAFEGLNFEGIVPHEALTNFEYAMDFKTTRGLAPVLPLR